MWKVDLEQYDKIFLFCLSNEMVKFEKSIKASVKPGTLVISNIFKFEDWKPIETKDSVYVYKA